MVVSITTNQYWALKGIKALVAGAGNALKKTFVSITKRLIKPRRTFVGCARINAASGWFIDFYCDKILVESRKKYFQFRLIIRCSDDVPMSLREHCRDIFTIYSDNVSSRNGRSDFDRVMIAFLEEGISEMESLS